MSTWKQLKAALSRPATNGEWVVVIIAAVLLSWWIV